MVISQTVIHAEDLKAELRKKFGSLRRFETIYRIPNFSASAALRRPHCAAEKAILRALGMPGNQVWPDRYLASGRRLPTQPRKNYGRAD